MTENGLDSITRYTSDIIENYYNHPALDLMFKNVYSMGSTNIDSQSLEVSIIDNFSTPISDRTDNGNTFLNLFGLDSFNQSGASTPDEVIDFNNSNIVIP